MMAYHTFAGSPDSRDVCLRCGLGPAAAPHLFTATVHPQPPVVTVPQMGSIYSQYQRAHVTRVVQRVVDELANAIAGHGPQRSAHEGWAVIYEELDELWDEVKRNHKARSVDAMRLEAMQVAAMAIRFMLDVTPLPVADDAGRHDYD